LKEASKSNGAGADIGRMRRGRQLKAGQSSSSSLTRRVSSDPSDGTLAGAGEGPALSASSAEDAVPVWLNAFSCVGAAAAHA
jgi:hypothetical protein